MKIWTLTVDGRQEVITTVHTSEASVFESLRVNYAEDEDVSDLDLMDHVIAQGNSVYVNEHEITPDPGVVDNPVLES